MTLAPGRRLSHYEVLSPLGAGGMGEVYRARDVRLDRTVAIKVLPERFAANADVRQRFEREAKAVSSLNHPHICTLHDIGSEDGVDFLVMELVEGETLAERLKKGALPLEQALRIAIGIASALEAAHRNGVIHRDLKPGNVMLTKSGAKLLDFGLAKQRRDDGRRDASRSQDTPLTTSGAIVGTPQYLSPEQLHGRDADARSDLFAFGAVLHEMLTGKRAFDGESPASVMAAILEHEPRPIAELLPVSPPALDRAVRQCLAKDPDERWQTAGDLRRELEWIAQGGSAAASASTRRSTAWIAWAVAAIAVVGAALLALRDRAAPVSAPATTFEFSVPPPNALDIGRGELAISPDGRRVAFVSIADGNPRLWIRELHVLDARPLPGTETASLPFWSPDGQEVGFFVPGKMMRISADGGPARMICPAPDGRGGAWNRDGRILFAPSSAGTLSVVNAEGGTPSEVTHLLSEPREFGHRFPQFLPDGRRFLYATLPRRADGYEIRLASLDSPGSQLVGTTDAGFTWLRPGYVVFKHDGVLLADRLDERTGALAGAPSIVDLQPTGDEGWTLSPLVSASDGGAVSFVRGGNVDRKLVRVDRRGVTVAGPLATHGPFVNLDLASDGTRLLASSMNARYLLDIWQIDVERDTATRLVYAGSSQTPLLSHDERWFAFASERGGYCDLYRTSASGIGGEERVLESDSMFVDATEWTLDDRQILFSRLDPQTGRDLWLLPLDGERKPVPYIVTPFNEACARLSPDGRWVAFLSDESGRNELYVQPFDKRSGKQRISSGGAGDTNSTQTRWVSWRRDGKELVYVATDGRTVFAVDVDAGDGFRASVPKELFRLPEGAGGMCGDAKLESFWITVPADSRPGSIVVETDWTSRLKSGR